MSKFLVNLTIDDMPSILNVLAHAYSDMCPYNIQYDEARVYEFLTSIPDIFALGLCDSNGELEGVLLGAKTLSPMSFTPIAVELIWYLRPEFRKGKYALQMVREFEKWAKNQNCAIVTIANLNDEYLERTGKFYNRVGYKLSEQTFYKEL